MAHDKASLREVSDALHDAYIDGPLEHDATAGVVAVPLVQEGFDGGPVAEQVPTVETWRFREYHVTFFRGRLIIRQVRAVRMPADWDDQLMIDSVEFDEASSRLMVCGDEQLELAVEELDVELQLSDEPGGHVRRRVGKLSGIVGDKWIDQY